MRQHRHPARLDYQADGALDRKYRAANVIFLPLLDVTVERVLHVHGQAKLHEQPRKMRPADDLAEASLHLVVIDRQPVGGHQLRHFPPARVAILNYPVEDMMQPVRLHVNVIAQHVHGSAVLRAYLDAGDYLHTKLRTALRGLGIAGHGVVIGYRNGGKPSVARQLHDLSGRERPVRRGGVHMQVDASHFRIASMNAFAAAYIYSGCSPMKNSLFS